MFYFASTSKISFPGSGVAIFAASDRNMEQILPIIGAQTISYDKLNQMRHVKYFGSADGIRAHMMKLADLIRPKFELVQATLDRDLTAPGFAYWTHPLGGYFISLYTMPGTARRAYALAKDAGVTLTTRRRIPPSRSLPSPWTDLPSACALPRPKSCWAREHPAPPGRTC